MKHDLQTHNAQFKRQPTSIITCRGRNKCMFMSVDCFCMSILANVLHRGWCSSICICFLQADVCPFHKEACDQSLSQLLCNVCTRVLLQRQACLILCSKEHAPKVQSAEMRRLLSEMSAAAAARTRETLEDGSMLSIALYGIHWNISDDIACLLQVHIAREYRRTLRLI
eukprot:1157936-Pelagomonas_calceolata.AAC.4